jgi:ubiquitin carboxyl-terminal hydrolase L5
MSSGWCTIESDPGVFSELVSEMGVEDVEVSEIYSLEEAEQSQSEASYGLVFLFKWRSEPDERAVLDPLNVPGLFYAHQTIQNACATQAILSVLLNAEGVELGQTLNNFKSIASNFDAETKGEAIGNMDEIRIAHNSFARPELFVGDENPVKATDKDDVYHFIAYVPYEGAVYELDGLKRGPILLGSVPTGQDWRVVAKPAIHERMERFRDSNFALLTIRRAKSAILTEELAEAEESGQDVTHLLTALEDEAVRKESEKLENSRRRFNYVPFIVELIKTLSLKGKLQSIIDQSTNTETS